MADVTISNLTKATPAGNNIIPYTTGSSTQGTPVSALFQNTRFVGINNTNPTYKLQVTTNSQGTDGIALNSVINNIGVGALEIRANNSQGANNGITQAGDQGIIFSAGNVNTGSFVLAPWNNQAASGMRMDSNGRVAIGKVTPSTTLDVEGTITCTSTVTNGVRTLFFSGNTTGNSEIVLPDIYQFGSAPLKATMVFDHWYANGYTAIRECYISVSVYPDKYTLNDLININTTTVGAWTVTRVATYTESGVPASDKTVIKKTAGSYGGTSTWWVKLEGNATNFNLYSLKPNPL